MNAAGIDVSSRKSTVAVLRPFGEVVRLPFDVAHNTEGLASLAEQLKALDGETRVVLEHTGRYYEPVAKALHEAGLYVSAVNPLLIKEYGANSLRRVKTDKADAVKIARYALDNWADLRDYTPMDTIRYDLKTLNRQFQLASKQRTASANNLIALLEQSFPGIEETIDPEQAIDRALETYQKKGYDTDWIHQRLLSIRVRNELTTEWQERGVQQRRLLTWYSSYSKPDCSDGGATLFLTGADHGYCEKTQT